jgi:hypothetical protein
MAVASELDGFYFLVPSRGCVVQYMSTAVPLRRFLSEVLEFKTHYFKVILYVVDTLFNVGVSVVSIVTWLRAARPRV